MAQLPSTLNTVKEALQGKGVMSHPIHVAINHVPLGFWEASVVFDLMSRQRRWRKLSEAGYYLNLFGICAALPTALTGLAEWLDIPQEHPAWKVATTHALLNDLALGLSVYNWWSRRDRRNYTPDQTNLLVGGALVSVLGLSGYLGGVLAHEYGYGTHRQGTAVEKQHESLVGPETALSEPKIVMSQSGDGHSLDSWAGVQSDQVQDRDRAVEETLRPSDQSREVGGTGI
ncbi:MAG TPA: DUF2231 domain-containing protein [Herpetosiphonaceae bacterium]